MVDIYGFQKLTLLDYPGKTACTVFLGGCSLRCPYCHNSQLISPKDASVMASKGDSITAPITPAMDEDGLLKYLKKRQGLLEGVCITGGEPLMTPGLEALLESIRDIGYSIKLDTNGTFPERLSALIDRGLIDYVAMDIKAGRSNYGVAVGAVDCKESVPGNLPGRRAEEIVSLVSESADILMEGRTDWEFRTTVVEPIHSEEDFRDISLWLEGADKYYLQPFVDRDTVPVAGLSAPDPKKLNKYKEVLSRTIARVEIRGV